ncbi:MAG: HigA family addiction module antitoxin [Planctomycetota bacterium]
MIQSFKHKGLAELFEQGRSRRVRQQLHRILSCTHPITTEMALRIGKFTGNGPGLWLHMQQAYDLWYTEQQMKEKLSVIEPVRL